MSLNGISTLASKQLNDEQFREMIDKVKAMEDELLRLTTPQEWVV